MQMSAGQIVMTFLFGGAGCFGIVCGLAIGLQTRRFAATARRATGRVVAYKEACSTSTDSSGFEEEVVFHHPVVEFENSAGVLLRAGTSTGNTPPAFPIGQTVTVLYSRDDPGTAEIDSFKQLWLPPLVLLGSGALMLAIAICVPVFNIPVRMG